MALIMHCMTHLMMQGFIGIIQPDGSKRYIIANGNDSHVFELTMSGSYRIYIQNETTESVHVEGAYSTY